MSRWTFAGVVVTSLVSLACGGAGGSPWADGTTFVCGGSQREQLVGHTVVIEGQDLVAVDAGGGCVLEIVDCDIEADFPIKAAGNARVTIVRGRITGRKQAIQAWGNAVVTVSGATVVGEVAETGNGKVVGLPGR